MENRDQPVDGLGTILWTQGQDSGNSKGFAGIGASFHGPGPVEWVGVKVMEDQFGDSRGSEARSEGALGECMVVLSYLREQDCTGGRG